jgi:hypothetical protein
MEILFLWIGLVFVGFGTLVVRFATSEFSDARRLDGEVIEYVRHRDSDGSLAHAPMVAFVHPVAGRRILLSALRSSNLPYRIGSRVKVLINVRDPTQARIDTKGFLLFGLALIGLLVWQASKHHATVSRLVNLMRTTVGGEVVDAATFDRSQLLSSDA